MAATENSATEDRSKWRYEKGGPALEAATQFVDLLNDPNISTRLDEVRERVTDASWPAWEAAVNRGFEVGWLTQLLHFSQTVRFPAAGMAYVVCPILHPDQDEPITINEPQQIPAHIVTLVEERGAWRVHQVGGDPVAPQVLGREPYSW